MCTYETYKYGPLIKKYHRNKPEVVSLNVKHIPVIPHIIGIIEHLFYICQLAPVSSFGNIIPII